MDGGATSNQTECGRQFDIIGAKSAVRSPKSERRNEGTKERRNEGTKERRNEGTKERRNEGTKERRNDEVSNSSKFDNRGSFSDVVSRQLPSAIHLPAKHSFTVRSRTATVHVFLLVDKYLQTNLSSPTARLTFVLLVSSREFIYC